MLDTIACMLESDSTFGLGIQIVTENQKSYNNVEELPPRVKNLLGYTVEKVCIVSDRNDSYYLEYTNNIERYMEDQKIYQIEEAITNIAEHYGLLEGDITIVIDESCIDKLDIRALENKYSVMKK